MINIFFRLPLLGIKYDIYPGRLIQVSVFINPSINIGRGKSASLDMMCFGVIWLKCYFLRSIYINSSDKRFIKVVKKYRQIFKKK